MLFFVLLLVIAGCILAIVFLTDRFGFRGVEYALSFSASEVTEGDTVILTETICSRKLMPVPWMKVELTTSAALEFAERQSAISEDTRFISSFFFLRPYRQIERHWQVKCSRRGVFTVDHAILVISDLLGIAEDSKPFPSASAQLTVLPRKLENVGLPSISAFCMTGDFLSDRRRLPDRFAISGLRQYADGDNVRDICHTASARSETPMVYRYDDTVSPSLTILLDLATREYDFERVSDKNMLEQAIRLCCSYLSDATKNRIPVRFLANASVDGKPVETTVASGEAHALRIRRLLANLPYDISERAENTLMRALSAEATSALLVLTAYFSPQLQQLAMQNRRITVISLRQISVRDAQPNVISAAEWIERKSE